MCVNLISEALRYCPETGALYWRERPRDHFQDDRSTRTWNARYAKTRAGSAGVNGRCNIRLSGRLFKAHRLVWFLHHGNWPTEQIDHINGNPADNRIENLREATNSQNQHNRGVNKNNTSGFKGVCWDRPRGKWRAQLILNRKTLFLGHYDNPEAASKAYQNAARVLHGEFARTNAED